MNLHNYVVIIKSNKNLSRHNINNHTCMHVAIITVV